MKEGEQHIKVRAGKYLKPVTLIYKGSRIFVKFKYNKTLIDEIKSMQGAKWHGFDDPPRKIWSIANSSRNHFQLEYLQGNNPYAWYDQEIPDIQFERPLRIHQGEMLSFIMTIRHGIIAGEMGTGKTLVAIEAMERLGLEDHEAWYVGPRSGIRAVSLELDKWNSKVRPVMFTYEGLVTRVKAWADGDPAPKIIILDESSKIKTPTAQRSQAAMHVADALREEYGYDGIILEMSGTPAPKAPTDWWHQCEVACPGFLREGQVNKFKSRLCLIEERQSITGGVYPHVVTWLDDENKCRICGQPKEHLNHEEMSVVMNEGHRFEKSENEVARLYRRMKGLVLVKFKKNCLDLPDKQYELIRVKPTPDMLRAARIIKKKSARAIEALTLLRELSDGFQYTDEVIGEDICPQCNGTGKSKVRVSTRDIDIMAPQNVGEQDFEIREIHCDTCGGVGKVKRYRRATDAVESPKDQVLIDELDMHEDCGRYVVWGGFTGTIDRLVDVCHKYGWATLRIDGRGFIGQAATGESISDEELLIAMDRTHPRYNELLETYPKLCVVGHPQAGGMALNLTASPTALFYSNCFNGEARMQAEDRIHRMGMDENRGATIKDIIHLATDKLVLDNLKKKKKLQSISMGELGDILEQMDNAEERVY